MTRAGCRWCDADEDLVLIGVIERGSSAAGGIYACGPCRARHRVRPISEVTESGPGRITYHGGMR